MNMIAIGRAVAGLDKIINDLTLLRSILIALLPNRKTKTIKKKKWDIKEFRR